MRKSKRSSRSAQDDKPADGLLTINEFCEWASISRRQYYVQRKQGLGPKEMRLGDRTIRITREEAHAWARRVTAGLLR
jgi:predicted DNA-binding transcriptional regulator AlpA